MLIFTSPGNLCLRGIRFVFNDNFCLIFNHRHYKALGILSPASENLSKSALTRSPLCQPWARPGGGGRGWVSDYHGQQSNSHGRQEGSLVQPGSVASVGSNFEGLTQVFILGVCKNGTIW